jgi:type VI secretion system secreted protein VgrG
LENFQAIAANAALSAFSGQSQNNRLLRLDFPFQDGPHAILLANRLDAQEEVSRSYRYNVEVLSDDARIPLKVMMARMVTISLVRADGSLRFFNGYVTQFRLDRTDGGFAFYHMVLEPWLAFTRLRKDSVSFHGKSVREITEETLKHFREADWHLHIFEEDPRLTVANQHNETDFNHLHRRWETLGLHYWFEHRYDGHTLMLSDSSLLAEPIDAIRYDDAQVIPFRATGGAHEDDGIHAWSAVRQLGSGSTTLASFDYKYAATNRATGESTNAQGDFYPYEIYENTGQYGFALRMDGEQLAQKRMVARDTVTQYFEAAGNDRVVQPGRVFRLGGHFSAEPRSQEHDPKPRGSIGDREYLILTVRHEASNNYQAGPGAPSHYKNTFTCVRSSMRWRPGLHYNSKPCTNPGLQTAIVVGPPGSEIHTDNYGRVKIQFHWDRLGKCDENSSPWIRVMAPAAGDQFGQIRLPRVGEEVAVVYPDGNIDHPLILGAVHNGKRMPPWALPEQAPLAGMRSRELGGGTRGNHLILDDTKGKIQAQLKSDHQCSQLSLGHITRIEDNAGRKDARGEGFELQTEAWGVLRAGRGMLVTTEARSRAHGTVKTMDESTQRLVAAATLQKALADAAHTNDLPHAEGDQIAVAAIVKEQNDAIAGAGSDVPFPELDAPHLVLASPAGIASTSAKSTHIASAEHTALTAGKTLSIVTGDSLLASVTNAIRLYVHKAGMRLIAAAGKVHIQAQSDDITAIANKVLTLISETDWVDIRGKKGVRLHGGAAMLEISDTTQFFTPSPTLFHGNLETRAPKNRPQPNAPTRKLDALPEQVADPEFLFHDLRAHPGGGNYEYLAYALYKGDAKVEDGMTDQFGRAKIRHEAGTPSYRIVMADGEEFLLTVTAKPVKQPALDETAAANDTPPNRQHD